MKRNISYISEAIVQFLSFMDNLSAEDISGLKAGRFIIKHEITPNENVPKKKCQPKASNIDAKGMIEELKKMNSEEEGEQYLHSKVLKKIDLEALLKELNLPARGNRDALIQSVINNTIRMRLNIKAIEALPK